MNKFFSTVLCMAALAGALWWLLHGMTASPQAEDLLPKDSVFFVQWKDGAPVWHALEPRAWDQELQVEKMRKLLGQMSVSDETGKGIEAALGVVRNTRQDPVLERWRRQGGIMALLADIDSATAAQRRPRELRSHVVFICSEAKEKDFLAAHLKGLLDMNKPPVPWFYQGLMAHEATLNTGQRLHCIRLGEQLICAFDPWPIKRCVDQYLRWLVRADQGFRANSWAAEHRRQAGSEADFFCYADLAVLYAQFWRELVQHPPPKGRLLPQEAAFFHTHAGTQQQMRLVARMKPDELDDLRSAYQLESASRIGEATMQDTQTQFYLWTNWLTKPLAQLAINTLQQAEPGVTLLTLGRKLLEMAGLQGDDFFRLFGSTFSLLASTTPSPAKIEQSDQGKTMLCLSLHLRQQQEVEEKIAALVSSLRPRSLMLNNGAEAISFSMAGGMVQPAYAILNGQLLLADHLDLIERQSRMVSLDWPLSPKNSQAELAPEANFFLYLQHAALAQGLGGLLHFAHQAQNDQGVWLLPSEQRLLLSDVLLPLLSKIPVSGTSRLRAWLSGAEAHLDIMYSSGLDAPRP